MFIQDSRHYPAVDEGDPGAVGFNYRRKNSAAMLQG